MSGAAAAAGSARHTPSTRAEAGAPAHPAPAKIMTTRDWVAVIGATLGGFMAVLDIQITNSALKDIQGGVAASVDEASWISTSYLIAEIIVIPLTGWLASIFSVRRFLMGACILFLVFSMLCGLSTSLSEMIVFRAGQGFTGGVFIPMALTIVLMKMPPDKRSIGLALFGFSATFAPAIGPTLGGYLTDAFNWRYIFYINLIPGVILLWAIWYGLDAGPMRLKKLLTGDWPGIIAMAIGLGSLEIVLEEGQRHDWFGSPMIVWLAIASFIGIGLFLIFELTARHPFVNLRLMLRPAFGSSLVMAFALGIGLYGSTYILPVYLGNVQGYDALQIGQVIMWAGLPQLFILPFLPLIMKRVDPRFLLAFGFTLFAVSCFINAHMSIDTAYDQLRFPQLIRAIGQPFIMIPLSGLSTGGVEAAEQGNASILFNIMRNLGGSCGIALLSFFATTREHFHFSMISERLTENGLDTQARISFFERLFGHTTGPAEAQLRGFAQMASQARAQAYVMAYSDCFFIMGCALAICAFGVFLLKRPKPGAQVAAH